MMANHTILPSATVISASSSVRYYPAMIHVENLTAESAARPPRKSREPAGFLSCRHLSKNVPNERQFLLHLVAPCLVLACLVGSSLFLRRKRSAARNADRRKNGHLLESESELHTTRAICSAMQTLQEVVQWAVWRVARELLTSASSSNKQGEDTSHRQVRREPYGRLRQQSVDKV